MRADIITLCTN